jgi:hypothetical protein
LAAFPRSILEIALPAANGGTVVGVHTPFWIFPATVVPFWLHSQVSSPSDTRMTKFLWFVRGNETNPPLTIFSLI